MQVKHQAQTVKQVYDLTTDKNGSGLNACMCVHDVYMCIQMDYAEYIACMVCLVIVRVYVKM